MRLCKAIACWVLLGFIPSVALALGLGEIRLESALNEPFSAEVALESVDNDKLDQIRVSLATADTFERYGLDRPDFLAEFRFKVQQNAAGEPVIRITSNAPVAEPFVSLLMDVKWGSGRLQREYTVLLDPPVFEDRAAQSVLAATVAPQTVEITPAETTAAETSSIETSSTETSSTETSSIDIAPIETAPAKVAASSPIESAEPAPAESAASTDREPLASELQASEPLASEPLASEPLASEPLASDLQASELQASAPQTETVSESATVSQPAPAQLTDAYTSQRGDTLWRIATGSKGDQLTTNQMMLAIYRANPEAFLGNINALKSGAALRLPAAEEGANLSVSQATAAAIEQHAAWSGRIESVNSESQSAAADSAAQPELVPPAETEEIEDTGAAAQLELVPPAETEEIEDTGAAAQLELVPPAETEEIEDTGAVAQLELVPPAETEGAGGDGDSAATSDRVNELAEAELDENQRLLSIPDAELSSLQQRIADLEQQQIETDGAAEGFVDIDQIGEEVVDGDAEIFVDEIDEPLDSPFADDAALLEDDSAGPEEAAVAETFPVEEARQPDPIEVADGEVSFVGQLLSSYWLWGAAGLMLLAGAGLFFARRRGSFGATESAAHEDSGSFEPIPEPTIKDFSERTAAADPILVSEVDTALAEDRGKSTEIREPAEEPEPAPLLDDGADDVTTLRDAAYDNPLAADDDAVDDVVDFDESEPETTIDRKSFEPDATEENRSARADDYSFTNTITEEEFSAADGPDDEPETPLEKTISTGAPLNLDQADPTAEADFHMAYGLYDQAAELLVKALDGEPDNREYRVKLLEVYFVWENKDGFLEQATVLHGAISDDSDADWNKVLILGKQLCPDAELFAGGAAIAPTADAMDLEFGEDAGEMDIDLSLGGNDLRALDESAVADGGGESVDAGLDFDLGDGGGDLADDDFLLNLGDDDDSGDATVAFGADEGIDPAATLKINAEDLAVTLESPTAELLGSEAPTMEADMIGSTMDSPTLEMPDSNAATASMPMLEGIDIEAPVAEHNDDSDSDSLDVDLSGLADFADSDEPADPKMDIDSTLNQLDNTGEFLKPEDVEDMSKTIAGGGDEPADPIGDNDATVLANTGAFEGFADLADGISDATAALPEIAAEDFAGLADETAEQPAPDVDANSTEATVEQPEVVAEDFSDDAGAGGMPEDATMTEVGTKLDLARAYIDMGDPDGARSILSEVMDEGGEPQQQEARQLLEELGD